MRRRTAGDGRAWLCISSYLSHLLLFCLFVSDCFFSFVVVAVAALFLLFVRCVFFVIAAVCYFAVVVVGGGAGGSSFAVYAL